MTPEATATTAKTATLAIAHHNNIRTASRFTFSGQHISVVDGQQMYTATSASRPLPAAMAADNWPSTSAPSQTPAMTAPPDAARNARPAEPIANTAAIAAAWQKPNRASYADPSLATLETPLTTARPP